MEGIFRTGEETAKIVKAIDKIVFQTNLLALNGAVEAAHAGEAGADEIIKTLLRLLTIFCSSF